MKCNEREVKAMEETIFQKSKKDACEFAEILAKVPERKKDRVMGFIEGVVACTSMDEDKTA